MDQNVMETKPQERKIRMCVGAIFLAILTLLQLYDFRLRIPMLLTFGIDLQSISWILMVLGNVLLVVWLLMKKRGVVVAVALLCNAVYFIVYLSDIIFVLSFLNFLLGLMSVLYILFFVGLAMILLGEGAGRFTFLKKPPMTVALYMLLIVAIVLETVFRVLMATFPQMIYTVLFAVAFVLITSWIVDPYENEKMVADGASGDASADGDYISLTKHILLLIFTFGIWQLIWVYRATAYTNAAKGEETRNPKNKMLLYLFIPFYSIYWTYHTAQRVDKLAKEKGVASELATVCLVLSIFVAIIPPILLQDKINQILTSKGAPASDAERETEALLKYKELLDMGVITEEEFNEKKRQILKG